MTIGAFYTTVLVVGCAALATAVAGDSAEQIPTASGVAEAVSKPDGADLGPGWAEGKIEIADGGSRFSGGSLRKETESSDTGGGKTGPSTNAGAKTRKDRASPSRFAESGGLMKPDKAKPASDKAKNPPMPAARRGMETKPKSTRNTENHQRSANSESIEARASEKAKEGLDAIQEQAQEGIERAWGNMKKATEAYENLAPDIGPRKVDEDYLNRPGGG